MSAIFEAEMDMIMEEGMKEVHVKDLMEKKNEFTVLSDAVISFHQQAPDIESKREQTAKGILETVKRLNRMSTKQKTVLLTCLVERSHPGYEL